MTATASDAAADPCARCLMAMAVPAEGPCWRRGAIIRADIAQHVADGQATGAFRRDGNADMAATIAFGMVMVRSLP